MRRTAARRLTVDAAALPCGAVDLVEPHVVEVRRHLALALLRRCRGAAEDDHPVVGKGVRRVVGARRRLCSVCAWPST